MNRFLRHLMLWSLALSVISLPSIVSATPQSSNQGAEQLIQEIVDLAHENQTLNSVPYGIGDTLADVEQDWGPADDKSTVFSNYWGRHVSFGYDPATPNETITRIDDFDPTLSTITLQKLKATIGEPLYAREVEGAYEVTYSANANNKIIFIFESAFQNPNPHMQMYLIESK